MSGSALHEPFSRIARQRESAMFGMWLFLASELLLFGGLFAGYAVYRWLHGMEFLEGARQTEIVYGTANTAILLTSSFFMAVATKSARAGFSGLARGGFILTAALGTAFLIVKGFEYRDDIGKHLVPGPGFALAAKGAEIFWTFYWVMTLVHALHLLIGIGAMLRLNLAGRHDPDWLAESAAPEVTALYWHYVDAIWVVLFPLLYLTGRA